MVREYKGVKNYGETGRDEILFNGDPIPHIPYVKSAGEGFTWGYNGAGPHNTARSILEHAAKIADEEINVVPNEHRSDFRAEYIASLSSSEDGWTIAYADVVTFLKNRES